MAAVRNKNEKSTGLFFYIFIVQFISNNLEQHMCKALTKCATVAQLKNKIQTSTTLTDMYTVLYSQKRIYRSTCHYI